MSYEAKTDWQYGDTPTETDANRWEQGIKDAHEKVNSLETSSGEIEQQVNNNTNAIQAVGQALVAHEANYEQLQTNYNNHLIQNVSRYVFATRDMSIVGNQKITLGFRPKDIQISAWVEGEPFFSEGKHAVGGGGGSCVHTIGITNNKSSVAALALINTGTSIFQGGISTIDNDGFNINWQIISGTPTGTVRMIILARTHGE